VDDAGQAGDAPAGLLVDRDLQRDRGPAAELAQEAADLGGRDDVAAEQEQAADALVDQPAAGRAGDRAAEPDQQELGEPGPQGRQGALRRGERARVELARREGRRGGDQAGGADGGTGGRRRRLPGRPVAPGQDAAAQQGRQQQRGGGPAGGDARGRQTSTSSPSLDQRVWKLPGRSSRR
jgi:hypothetical protein